MKMRWLSLLLPLRLILAVVLLFLLWQGWVFLRPRPRPLTVAEVNAIGKLCHEAATLLTTTNNVTPVRFAVARLANDHHDVVTTTLRETLATHPGWEPVEGSPINRFVTDVATALHEATSLDEILHAGRRVNIDLLLAGRLMALEQTNQTATVALRLYAYDTRSGSWLMRDTLTATWSPSVIERLSLRFHKTGWVTRASIWLLLLLALPWLTPFVTRYALTWRSNAASALLLGGYTLIALLLAILLQLFETPHGTSWFRFLLLFLISGGYNFWACEHISTSGR